MEQLRAAEFRAKQMAAQQLSVEHQKQLHIQPEAAAAAAATATGLGNYTENKISTYL